MVTGRRREYSRFGLKGVWEAFGKLLGWLDGMTSVFLGSSAHLDGRCLGR